MSKSVDWINKRPYFRHFVIEIECKSNEINSMDWIKAKIELFISILRIHTLKYAEYQFEPQGISLIYIISSSHISVHTYPENHYIHIDLMTCSKNKKLNNMEMIIDEVFPSFECKVLELNYAVRN